MLNMRELLCGDPARLRYVVRFGTCFRMHDESVAEHSFFVCYYAAMLGRWWEQQHGKGLNWQHMMSAAAVHDGEEGLTGDIPRPFKYVSPTVTDSVNDAASVALLHSMEVLHGEGCGDAAYWHHLWDTAKDMKTAEGRIVAFADFLSVLSWAYTELLVAKNALLRKQLSGMLPYYEQFTGNPYFVEEFQPLLEQLRPLMEEVMRHG